MNRRADRIAREASESITVHSRPMVNKQTAMEQLPLHLEHISFFKTRRIMRQGKYLIGTAEVPTVEGLYLVEGYYQVGPTQVKLTKVSPDEYKNAEPGSVRLEVTAAAARKAAIESPEPLCFETYFDGNYKNLKIDDPTDDYTASPVTSVRYPFPELLRNSSVGTE